MKNFKRTASIATAKTVSLMLKVAKSSGGTSLPGKLARKIYPDVFKDLISQVQGEIFAVTGTNGKTTTSGLIAAILNANNRKIVHNRKGANMLTGITSAVIEQSSITGKLTADTALLEMDEAYLSLAVDEFLPHILLVTNLFRDQLDRYGELDTTAKKIQLAIDKVAAKKEDFKVILNADDPMVSMLGEYSAVKRVFYGLEQINFVNCDSEIKAPQEIVSCRCGNKVKYTKTFYGHIGHYNCDCGYNRPTPDIKATAEIYVDHSILHVKTHDKEEFEVKVNLPGLYNAYNALGAVALCLHAQIPVEDIQNGAKAYSTVFGRAESTVIKGKKALIQLIKNPIGATEVLRTVKDDRNSRILIIINDNYADGRDVSWLWDANFDLLANHQHEITVSGVRASDMAVRLKYAGINSSSIKVIEDIKEAIEYAADTTPVDQKLYVLPTYTALLSMQNVLKKF